MYWTNGYFCDEDCISCVVAVLDGWIEPSDFEAIDEKTFAKGLDAFWRYRVREAWSFHCQFHLKQVLHCLKQKLQAQHG